MVQHTGNDYLKYMLSVRKFTISFLIIKHRCTMEILQTPYQTLPTLKSQIILMVNNKHLKIEA